MVEKSELTRKMRTDNYIKSTVGGKKKKEKISIRDRETFPGPRNSSLHIQIIRMILLMSFTHFQEQLSSLACRELSGCLHVLALFWRLKIFLQELYGLLCPTLWS